jgi:hypothetical protein
MSGQFPTGRRIYGITDFLSAHCSRIDFKPMGHPSLIHHMLEHILSHRGPANIAVAYEQNFCHDISPEF